MKAKFYLQRNDENKDLLEDIQKGYVELSKRFNVNIDETRYILEIEGDFYISMIGHTNKALMIEDKNFIYLRIPMEDLNDMYLGNY